MKAHEALGRLFLVMLFVALAAFLVGCQPTDQNQKRPAEGSASSQKLLDSDAREKSSKDGPTAKTSKVSQGVADPKTRPEQSGQPLVEDASKIKLLNKKGRLWLDEKNRQIVMVGEVCQRRAPLEMFACLKHTKEHESIVAVDVKAAMVHAALLAIGAEAGSPVKFTPEYTPASGTEIDVNVAWKDKNGNIQRSKAQEWVRNIHTKKAMDSPWVFAGSGFWEDEQTREKHYLAELGDFICVSNFPSAMLDLPIESSQGNSALMFEAFTERIPSLGTPVTIILKPKLDEKPQGGEKVEKK